MSDTGFAIGCLISIQARRGQNPAVKEHSLQVAAGPDGFLHGFSDLSLPGAKPRMLFKVVTW